MSLAVSQIGEITLADLSIAYECIHEQFKNEKIKYQSCCCAAERNVYQIKLKLMLRNLTNLRNAAHSQEYHDHYTDAPLLASRADLLIDRINRIMKRTH